jgi:predicted GNAT family acetyltransferase
MEWRSATTVDVPLLAELNRQLIEDEEHPNSMSLPELAERMRGWLETEYRATLFESEGGVVAYALYREDEWARLHVRQFYVTRETRRRGFGREAMRLLQCEVVPAGKAVILEVLTTNATARAFYAACGFTEYSVAMIRKA